MESQQKWDSRYKEEKEPVHGIARVLAENDHLLLTGGRALDLACGTGTNALFLSEKGLDVCAWDISPVAIERLGAEAARRNLNVGAKVRDVVKQPPGPESFDVILVVHFLDRSLTKSIMDALKPGGVLFYQTFTRTKTSESGPRNPEYLLSENELLRMFSPLQILAYREEGLVGDVHRGFRNEAMLVALKV